jgi:glycosyltransferase involved in cell wall biosynthesis
MLYYYLWQRRIVAFIKKQNINFDIVHNVNFHNDWTPSFLWKLDKPMVWGPVGHHPLIPKQYLNLYSRIYWLKDRITWLIKNIFWKYSPSLKKTIKNANHIWCMNTSVPSVLKLNSEAFSVFPSIASEDFYTPKTDVNKNFNVISVGRFVPLKGFDLTLYSFIDFINSLSISERKLCKLTLVGSGPEKELYKKIISDGKVEAYVEIIEWIDRVELMKLYGKSSVFLFPSHEGAGMVVAEALSFGLPVICLENEGPGQYITSECGFAVSQLEYSKTISALKESLQQLHSNKVLTHQMGVKAREKYLERFTWNSRGEHLQTIYKKL